MTPSNRRSSLNVLEWRAKHTFWRVSSFRQDLGLDRLRGAEFLIAVSLRNPRFSNAWIRAVAAEIIALDGRVLMCVVDDPYFERARRSDSAGVKERLAVLRAERMAHQKRLEEIASRFPEGAVRLFSWEDVQEEVPARLIAELNQAFSKPGDVREAIKRQVQMVRGANLPPEEIERSSIFLLAEFPVLTYIYYSLIPDAIDVYPGPQADFFWQIESGRFQDSLPLASSMASSKLGLIYADVSLTSSIE